MGRLANAIVTGDKDAVLNIVDQQLKDGENPLEILEELRKGLEAVGEKFEKGEYFLFDLIYSGEIFKEAASKITPIIKKRMEHVPTKGKVLIGTVKGDIHDIGKNIVITLLECSGFEVKDLGIDIPPEKFVDETRKYEPDIVGLSGLLTASIDFMQKTIELFEKEGLRNKVKIMVGGGIVGDAWTRDKVKADLVTTSAVEGVNMAKKWGELVWKMR